MRTCSIDIAGKKFGKLTAIKFLRPSKRGNVWLCLCECGRTKEISAGKLKDLKSCGCGQLGKRSHGMTNSRIFRIWTGMRNRCNNPKMTNYADYGGRGIKVCEAWNNSFEAFYEDMKEGYSDDLSLDRIDNDKDYYKDNCRWATNAEQNGNKRTNCWLEANGIKLIKSDWEKRFGLSSGSLDYMLRQGYSMQEVHDHYSQRLPKGTRIKESLCQK